MNTHDIKLPSLPYVAFCRVSDIDPHESHHRQLGVSADTRLYTEDQVRAAIEAGRKRSLLWDYCPECGNTEHTSHVGCGNFCTNCGQEWHSDIDYSEAVQKNLSDRNRRGEPVELQGVSEALSNGDGFWRSCTGCHETNEGHATGSYSEPLQCHLGIGCSECGGIGAIWDDTDYEAMADYLERDMGAPQPAEPSRGEPVAWLYEDELPDNYPYADMFPYSKVDGVRMFPVYAPQPTDPVVKDSLTVPEGWKLVPKEPTSKQISDMAFAIQGGTETKSVRVHTRKWEKAECRAREAYQHALNNAPIYSGEAKRLEDMSKAELIDLIEQQQQELEAIGAGGVSGKLFKG